MAQALVTTYYQVASNKCEDQDTAPNTLHLEEPAAIGLTFPRIRQDQPPTVRSTRNLPSREPSPTMVIRSLKKARRAVRAASCGYQRTQAQATTTHNCRRVALRSLCLEESPIPLKIRTTACQAQESMSQSCSTISQVSSSSIPSDPEQASKRRSTRTQLVHRSTLQPTQVRHSPVRRTLARHRRMQSAQRRRDRSVMQGGMARALSSRMRTSGSTGRSVRRQLSTWESQGQASTRSLATSTSETRLDLMTDRARTPSSASA